MLRHYRRAERVSPGAVKQFPPSLEALLEDRRLVGTHRHLRRIYPDPINPSQPWGLLRGPDGRIRGVFSTSELPPLRQEAIDLGVVRLERARSYHDWKFVPQVTP